MIAAVVDTLMRELWDPRLVIDWNHRSTGRSVVPVYDLLSSRLQFAGIWF